MATQLLIVTDVLTDYLRDYPEAVSYVEAQQERLLISVVTVAELYAGVREGEERSRTTREHGLPWCLAQRSCSAF
jgi:predicted nucleic acid-binding protein